MGAQEKEKKVIGKVAFIFCIFLYAIMISLCYFLFWKDSDLRKEAVISCARYGWSSGTVRDGEIFCLREGSFGQQETKPLEWVLEHCEKD